MAYPNRGGIAPSPAVAPVARIVPGPVAAAPAVVPGPGCIVRPAPQTVIVPRRSPSPGPAVRIPRVVPVVGEIGVIPAVEVVKTSHAATVGEVIIIVKRIGAAERIDRVGGERSVGAIEADDVVAQRVRAYLLVITSKGVTAVILVVAHIESTVVGCAVAVRHCRFDLVLVHSRIEVEVILCHHPQRDGSEEY